MAWSHQSRRRSELPRNWPHLRLATLRRDNYDCTIRGERCTGTATHADHIDPQGPHELWNLRAACQTCHMGRTARQSHAARTAKRRQPEPHPNRGTRGVTPTPPRP